MKKRHGEVRLINGKRVATPEYRAWQALRNRCLNKAAQDYGRYGGRGITLCNRWHKYENFLVDMGRRPTALHTLDRINNDQGYSKRNCRWATRETQARNRGSYNKCSLAIAGKIRTLYATGAYYQHELASIFKLTQPHVSQIVRDVAWKGGA